MLNHFDTRDPLEPCIAHIDAIPAFADQPIRYIMSYMELANSKREHWLGWSAKAGSVVYGVLGALNVVPAVQAYRLFEVPGLDRSALTIALTVGLVASPFVFLFSAVALRSTRRNGTTVAALSLPLVWLAYFVVVSTLVSVACAGHLACR